MTKRVHVQVFYSPSCPFSFREIEKVRNVVVSFGDQVSYEEINIYAKQKKAEKMGFYGLLSRFFIPIFIDRQRYGGSFSQEELGGAIRKALETKEC